MTWTPEQKEFVRTHYQEMSRAKLAEAVNKEFGTNKTRNSVIGLITRMGLAVPGGQSQNARGRKQPAKPKKSKTATGSKTPPSIGASERKPQRLLRPVTQHGGLPVMPFGRKARNRTGQDAPRTRHGENLIKRRRIAMRSTKIPSRELLLLDLEPNDCRYSTSQDGTRHRFCGAPQIEGFSYCPHHALKIIAMDNNNYRIASDLIKRTEDLLDAGYPNV